MEDLLLGCNYWQKWNGVIKARRGGGYSVSVMTVLYAWCHGQYVGWDDLVALCTLLYSFSDIKLQRNGSTPVIVKCGELVCSLEGC